MAVGSGRYKHPEGASPTLVKLIDAMLVVEPEKRPDIQTVRFNMSRALCTFLACISDVSATLALRILPFPGSRAV